MQKLINIIENQTWYRQLAYGGIVSAFFLILTGLGKFHPFFALMGIALIATAKEHYVEHSEGYFNWRNFLLFILPIFIIYVFLTW
jgi:hypothetical protein